MKMISSPDLVDIRVPNTSQMALKGDWMPPSTVDHQQNDDASNSLSDESCENCCAWTVGAVDVPRTLPIRCNDEELNRSFDVVLNNPSCNHLIRRQPLHPQKEPKTSAQTSNSQSNGYLPSQTTLSSLSQPAQQDGQAAGPTPTTTQSTTSTLEEQPIGFTGSLYQDQILSQPSQAVEAVLSAACETMNFDIAELWLRTGPKTHQLTHTHVRPTSLENSVRKQLVDVYYGARSSERVHNLSPALCKRAKEAQDVVWVTSLTEHGAAALRCSISDVRTAVAVPVCHETSRTNMTVIFFSIRRAIMKPIAVEFLVHMSLATANACINRLSEEVAVVDQPTSITTPDISTTSFKSPIQTQTHTNRYTDQTSCLSKSEHVPFKPNLIVRGERISMSHIPETTYRNKAPQFTVSGASLDLRWSNLTNVEYLTDGGNNWIHTAVLNRRPVVVKWLKPECQDLAIAINEIEDEIGKHHSFFIHSFIHHEPIIVVPSIFICFIVDIF